MANETNQPANGEGAQQLKTSEAANQTSQMQKVELPADQYNALLDRIAELESLSLRAPTHRSEGSTDIDDLASEARGRRQQVEDQLPENIDELSNTQLLQLMVNAVNKQGGERLQNIEVAVESMRMVREIDKAEAKHDDFWKYESEIRKIAMANPTLSIEQAYKLAKTDDKGKPDDKGANSTHVTTTQRVLNLPPRATGEKPGIAAGSTGAIHQAKTVRSAAERAFDEVVGKGKSEI